MTTRMVSPKPLSDFVPDVTLIAFPIPGAFYPRGGRAFSSREPPLGLRVEKMVLILMLKPIPAQTGIGFVRSLRAF
jgi:hypothetical protein